MHQELLVEEEEAAAAAAGAQPRWGHCTAYEGRGPACAFSRPHALL